MLTPETVRLLGSTKKVVDKDKDGDNAPKLESVEVVLVHCNLVENDYQHGSKVLNISQQSPIMMNTVNTELSFY